MKAVNTPWPIIKNHSPGLTIIIWVVSVIKIMDNKIRSDKISLGVDEVILTAAQLSPETVTPSTVFPYFPK